MLSHLTNQNVDEVCTGVCDYMADNKSFMKALGAAHLQDKELDFKTYVHALRHGMIQIDILGMYAFCLSKQLTVGIIHKHGMWNSCMVESVIPEVMLLWHGNNNFDIVQKAKHWDQLHHRKQTTDIIMNVEPMRVIDDLLNQYDMLPPMHEVCSLVMWDLFCELDIAAYQAREEKIKPIHWEKVQNLPPTDSCVASCSTHFGKTQWIFSWDISVSELQPTAEAVDFLDSSQAWESLYPEQPTTPQKSKRLNCPLCDHHCDRPSQMDLHYKSAHSGHKMKCVEENCTCEYSIFANLLHHQKIKHCQRKFPCHVQNCAKEFAYLYELQAHIGVHNTLTEFLCDEPSCGKKFTTSKALNAHKETHSGTRYSCSQCNFVCT